MSDQNVVPLSRFRADLSRALSRRGQEMLEATDLAARMEALEPLEAYLIVKELGVGDSVPLLQHATAEQLQAFVDLDCWEANEPSLVDLDAWLAPFAADGPESLARIFVGLEEELQTLYLAGSFGIYDARAEDAPEPGPDERRMATPDGCFVLITTTEGEEREVDPLFLVQSLYAQSVEDAFRRLMAAKWDCTIETEERALQFRSARLEDLGFPPPSEAARLFSPPPAAPRPAARVRQEEPSLLPALYAAPLAEPSLLGRALTFVSAAAEVGRLERELVLVINSAVIAYGEAPRDLAHIAAVAQRVRDTISLGLEMLMAAAEPAAAGSDDEARRAAALLVDYPLADLFRHGHREVAALQRATKALAADPILRSWIDRATPEGDEYTDDRADRAFVRALLAARPLLSGIDPQQPEKARAFARREELAAAEARLDRIAKRLL
jgi:hypothetical protein